MADRIAAGGYVVLAPNVFYRARAGAPVISLDGLGDPERREEVFGRVMPLMKELTTERIVADGSAYLARLADEADGGAGRGDRLLHGRQAGPGGSPPPTRTGSMPSAASTPAASSPTRRTART